MSSFVHPYVSDSVAVHVERKGAVMNRLAVLLDLLDSLDVQRKHPDTDLYRQHIERLTVEERAKGRELLAEMDREFWESISARTLTELPDRPKLMAAE